MKDSGWIKLHRKLLDNPLVMKDADHVAIWIFLLLNATHGDYPAIFKGNKIILKPGQLITGRKAIANLLLISESKVRRILDEFENDHQIDQQTSNKNRLITIVNWQSYQKSDQQNGQQVTNKWPTSDQQLTTNKNKKNKKNVRNIYREPKRNYAELEKELFE